MGVKNDNPDKDLDEEFLVDLPVGLIVTAFYTEKRFTRKKRKKVDGKTKTVEETVVRRVGNEMFAISKGGQYRVRRILNPGFSSPKPDPSVRYWLELIDLSKPQEFSIVGTLESRLQRMGVVRQISTREKQLATETD